MIEEFCMSCGFEDECDVWFYDHPVEHWQVWVLCRDCMTASFPDIAQALEMAA